MEAQRVQKIISNAGMMSRRKAEEFIAQGRVRVNGKIIKLGDKAAEEDKITVDGKQVSKRRKRYIMFHKPPNCLTTLDDPKGRRTIFSYVKEKERLIPVGRLDFLTEGLLLLTNDGDFANKIMHPRYEVKKNYMAFLDRPLSDNDRKKLEAGVVIEGKKTSPAKVTYESEDKDLVQVSIHEGRNRIVRKMLFSLGYKTKRLIRIKIGKLDLGDLPKGKYRELTKKEIEKLV
jgi:23S rRNA pseudouridine2605 synthase